MKAVSKVCDCVSHVWTLAIVAILSLLPSAAFAQSTASVTEIVASDDWEALITDFVTTLGPLLLIVIGAAFGLSLVVMVVKWIKRLLFGAK